jgi:hypothetical protein
MDRESIIRMAREACDKDKVDPWHGGFWTITQEELERFAALVAAAEREECAKVAESMRPHGGRMFDEAQSACFSALTDCAVVIRARGQE